MESCCGIQFTLAADAMTHPNIRLGGMSENNKSKHPSITAIGQLIGLVILAILAVWLISFILRSVLRLLFIAIVVVIVGGLIFGVGRSSRKSE